LLTCGSGQSMSALAPWRGPIGARAL